MFDLSDDINNNLNDKDNILINVEDKQKDIGGTKLINQNSLSSFEEPQINILNQITMVHKIDKGVDRIRLLDKDFVENNNNNCYLVIDGKQK